MDVNIVISLIILVLATQISSQRQSVSSESKVCKVIADVVVVFEIPAGRSRVAHGILAFFRRLRIVLNPSPSCIRLSFILAWKEVNTIIRFDCSYRRGARCVILADNSLTSLQYKFPETREFDKNNLVKAIDSANTLLFSELLGARKGVKKVCLLILNSGSKKNAIPTEDAVKNLHDYGVVVIAVGIKDGGKEKLDEIAMYPQYAVNVPSIRALSETPTIKQLGNLIIKPVEEIAKSPEAGTSAIALQSIPDSELLNIKPDDLKESCTYIVDIGFLVDSSGSLRKHYEKEKYFVRRIASKFNISQSGSHGGLVIFSARNYVKTVIQFNDYTNLRDFNNAVENIPYYGYLTRIDLALDKAHEELFTLKDGARPNVRKVAFLITDGRQNPDFEYGVPLDAAENAAPLHNRGINIFAVGIGERINLTELALITRSKNRVYTVKNFDELISDEFVKNVSRELCQEGILEKNETISRRRSTTPKPLPSNATVLPSLQPTPEPCKKTCSSCGCSGNCCNQKPDVYINVFQGSNNKNYVSQGMKVTQSGNAKAESSVNFPTSIDSGKMVKQSTKDMSAKEIAAIIKDCLPYQKKMNAGIQELLRRSIKTQTNKKRRK